MKKVLYKIYELTVKTLSHIVMLLLTAVIVILVAGAVLCYGPSVAARDFFVTTVTETSALKFLARIYLPQEEIDAIMKKSGEKGPPMITKPIDIPPGSKQTDEIEIIPVSGELYSGTLMIVHDPSRVHIYTIDSFSTEGRGKSLMTIYNQTGAIAATNAGGFYDPSGGGSGGMPLGYVIKDGVLVSSFASKYDTIIGFTENHSLIVGKMSPTDAINMGVKEAISFGPALVVNGERSRISSSGALHPRTAIGQRADGAILLLVIDGRQPHSVGISYKGLQDIMIEYGAVNAANLDGGSSSSMIYQGEFLTKSASLVGSRYLPSAIIVK